MTPQHLRNKSAGDLIKKQPVPPPQRPTLQSRTYSAPAGELPRPRHSKQPDGIIAAIDESNPLPYAQDASGHIPNETMVNMAVVGAQGVGKSTLVKYALDLKQTPNCPLVG
ncbi:hypothetical protein CISG_01423 [Coccidioides immitis RMSCC 3703]|uniref:Uncharacterized protein n=1 Tax=Coccidioides immitis RMSCC 3703 TaxID=454286 RepID=A0A0J8QYW8_COCIT|nr:hypothetical protein CISG_01423 [Coccidioides immitis RMSCC 3703]